MRYSSLFLFLLFSALSMQAQWPANVTETSLQANGSKELKGNLSQGEKIDDLSWASRSSTACWPGTQNTKFRGNHVFYAFQLPPKSELDVVLIPDNPADNFSLYGYQIGTTSYHLPPKLSSCVTCEADHKWDYPKKGKTQDHTRSVSFNAIRNPYNIVIGVVGGEGQTSGSFTLKLVHRGGEQPAQQQGQLKVYRVAPEKGMIKAWKGDLAKGTLIHDLDWASRSSTACWPGTQNKKFRGKHIFYVTEIPPRSKMTITLIPGNPKHNFSLYAYQDGVNSKAYPPNLTSCVSCEADHKWDYPKKGKTQDHTRSVSLNAIQNPYRVVIGIAGAEGQESGAFQLQIKLE